MLAFVPCLYFNNVIAFCISQFLLKFTKSLSLPLVFFWALMKFCPLSLQRWLHVLDGGQKSFPTATCVALMCKTQMIWKVAHRTSVTSSNPWELLCLTHPDGACLPSRADCSRSAVPPWAIPHLPASYYRYCFYGASFSTARHLDQSGT